MANTASRTDVSPDLQTSPIYRIRGQRSRWRYPNENLTPEHTTILRDINLSEFGTADSRYGYTTYNSTILSSSEAVVGLIQETFTTGTHQFVITPTKIYHDDGTTRTDLTGALTLNGNNDNRTIYAFLKDKIVGTNGVNATWVKDNGGATGAASALGGVPWSTCESLITHNGLLLALAPTEGGSKKTTRVRWCDINTRTFVPDITTWPDANRYEIYEGGAPIIGGVDNFGQAIIFKSDGMYSGSIEYSVGYLEFRLSQNIIRGFHPIARNSFVARPEFVWGIAKEGPFIIRPDFSFQLISKEFQDEWNGLAASRLQYAVSWINERDHQVHTLLSKDSTGLDLLMVWDWETGETSFQRPNDIMNFGARVVLDNTEYSWFGGRGNGYIYKGNNAAYEDDAGVGIDWQVRMAPNDLGKPGVSKWIVDLITVYRDRTGTGSVTLSVYRDQGQKSTRTTTLALASPYKWNGGYAYNSGLTWGGAQNRESQYFVNREAENISPEWTGSNPISLVGYQVTYTLQEP